MYCSGNDHVYGDLYNTAESFWIQFLKNTLQSFSQQCTTYMSCGRARTHAHRISSQPNDTSNLVKKS